MILQFENKSFLGFEFLSLPKIYVTQMWDEPRQDAWALARVVLNARAETRVMVVVKSIEVHLLKESMKDRALKLASSVRRSVESVMEWIDNQKPD